MLKLIGVLIIVIGFIRKYNPVAVVLVAGVVTGLVAKLNIMEILSIIGKAFVDTRYMSLFLLTLPVIGVLERYGLKERGATIIKSLKSVTAGKVLGIYLIIREIAAALSLRLGGHVQFIRPLIYPMSQSAAERTNGKVDEAEEEQIKGLAAMSENIGNFFGQNIFPAGGGVLLIIATLKEFGYNVTDISLSKAAVPMGILACVYSLIQYKLFDKKLEKKAKIQERR